MKNGEECYCYENIPYADLQTVPSENETVSCSSYCKGGNDYICGGPEAVSIYVASMTSHFLFHLVLAFTILRQSYTNLKK